MLPFIFPKTSQNITLNCLFPNTLQYENLISPQSRKDTQPPENTVSFCGIHGSCQEKNYCFFHLPSTVANTTWASSEACISASQFILHWPFKSQVHYNSKAITLISWCVQMILVSEVRIQFQVSFLRNEGNCDFCFQG